MSTVMPTPNDESNVKKALRLGLVPVRLAAKPVSMVGERVEEIRDLNAARKVTKPQRESMRNMLRTVGHQYRQQQAAAKAQAKIKDAEIERFEEELPGFVITLPKH
jgi:anti-sigma factor RsiW